MALMGAALEAFYLQLSETDPVQVVIADHPEFSAKAQTLYNLTREHLRAEFRIHLAPIVRFGSPSEVVQLQVADLVVYELNRLVADGTYRPGNQTRWPMLQLMNYRRFNWLYFETREQLEAPFRA